MKKLTAYICLCATILLMVSCSAQSGGQTAGSQNSNTSPEAKAGPTDEEIEAEPFTINYEYSEELIKSFTENDTFESINEGGPFYTGNVIMQQPGLKRFQELKKSLVEETVKATDKVEAEAVAYANDLKVLKNKYYDYMGQALANKNKLLKQMKSMLKDALFAEVKYTANFAQYESINPASKNEAVNAFLKYGKTYLAQQNVLLLTEDTAQTTSGLMTLSEGLATGDEEMKKIAAQIESEAAAMVDALGVKLLALQQSASDLGQMLKQLNTAEYYMGQASVQYMEAELAKLQPQIDALKPAGILAADDISMVKELAKYYGDFAGEIKTQLANVDKKELIADAGGLMVGQNQLIPLALAEDEGYASKAFGAMKTMGKGAMKLGQYTWESTKATLKTARTTVGVTIDTLGAGTKSGFDVIFGAANGNSASEIAQEIGNNFKKVGQNWQEGKSGSETLKTATGYFEGAEKAGGELASGAVEKVIGKGWTSWMAGHAGNLTVNMFTSLGKGITKVANPESTTGEIVEGGLDIGLSFIGGSKIFASGSQIAKGSKQALKLFGEKGINFLGKLLNSSDIKALKGMTAELLTKTKLTPSEVNKLLSNALNIECKEALQEELKLIGKNLNDKFMKMLKGGASTVLENSTTGAKEEFKIFVEKQFENSIKGYKDALIQVLGEGYTSYIDNLIANKADDVLKETIKDYIDKGKIPGIKSAPELSVIAGKWNSGTMVINDVETTEDFRKKAEKEGCDISEIESKKGKPQSLDISLDPTSESGGNMLIKYGDSKAQKVPFTYEDGALKASLEQEGASVKMDMDVTEGENGYSTSGGMKIDYLNGGLKINASMDANKPLPVVAPATQNRAAPGVADSSASIGR
ncbi:hypothetical protein KBB06_03235 [Candidatus Gracilibacteria bacterium]|nr:hypothetical protein [Candidatus Gracilibacteria bacterium]